MIEFQPQCGPQQNRKASSGNRWALKYGLRTVLGFCMMLGWVGQPALALPKKPAAHRSVVPKKASGAKPYAHSGKQTSRSKGKPAKGKPATKAGSRSAKGRSTARGRQPAVPFKPRYSVARPVHEPPVREPLVQEVPVPAARVPESRVPEVVTPMTQTPDADTSELADSMLAEPSGGPFRYSHALDSFFRALAALQPQGTADVQNTDAVGPSIVRAMQFGDSHTAADLFTGEMRAQLQAKFGNGGLGFQYPGKPFAGYRLLNSTRAQTYGWVTEGNRFNDLGDGDTGLGGLAISTGRPGESVWVTTTCETLQVQYLRQAGGGRLDFSDNGLPVAQIDTNSSVESDADPATTDIGRGAGTFTYACTPGSHEFQLITVDEKPVRLLGMVTEQPGITYECLGINGAVAPLILRWNQQMFADTLGQRNPNLIVLAYGTNEAAGSPSHNDEYVAEFHQLLQNLHRIVPNASILVLGPYDRAIKVGRGRRAQWRLAPGIDRIIADQREACRVDNCAFYDQRARMGGPGVMSHWVANGLAQGDHTHLTGAGYRVLADALYRDLMAVYNLYHQAPANSRLLVPAISSKPQPAS